MCLSISSLLSFSFSKYTHTHIHTFSICWYRNQRGVSGSFNFLSRETDKEMVRFSIIPLVVQFLYLTYFPSLSTSRLLFCTYSCFPVFFFTFFFSIPFVFVIFLSELMKYPGVFRFNLIGCFIAVYHTPFNTGDIINFIILAFNYLWINKQILWTNNFNFGWIVCMLLIAL